MADPRVALCNSLPFWSGPLSVIDHLSAFFPLLFFAVVVTTSGIASR